MTESRLILIPALNAEPYLGAVVEGCGKVSDVPVLVVDDGSSDATGRVARDAGAEVIRHEVNLGKGAALKTGFQVALERDCAAVVTIDADGQHLPSEIPRFFEEWERTSADLIIGSRSHLFDGMVRRRRAANQFSAWAISTVSGVKLTDSQSGFRLYSRRLIDEVTIRTNGFEAESEVIVRAGRGGFRIESITIALEFVDGLSTSHYRPVADTARIVWTVARTRFVG